MFILVSIISNSDIVSCIDIKTFIDHVLSGITCQPISLQDFRYYLQNKEHSAENLDFYFWYLDYKNRFDKLPEFEKAKSPPPKERPSPARVNFLAKIDKDLKVYDSTNINYDEEKDAIGEFQETVIFEQPFRDEINTVIQTFFHEDSFKELNIEGYMSRYIIFYGNQTTHPDVFIEAHEHIYNILKTSSFKSFIHYAVQNIRYGYNIIQYAGACFNFVHIPLILYYTFSHHLSRWYRLTLFWFTFFFAASLLSNRADFCTIRGVLNFRQVPLYELAEYDVNRGIDQDFKKDTGDVEKIGDNKPRDMTALIDPNVLKYTRVSRQKKITVWCYNLKKCLTLNTHSTCIYTYGLPVLCWQRLSLLLASVLQMKMIQCQCQQYQQCLSYTIPSHFNYYYP
jgi:hypothetical protein